jgi:hypothetical protein
LATAAHDHSVYDDRVHSDPLIQLLTLALPARNIDDVLSAQSALLQSYTDIVAAARQALPAPCSNDSDDGIDLASDVPSRDHTPCTPPRVSPSKKHNSQRTPDRSGPHTESPSTLVSSMTLSSLDSQADLGDYVAKQGRRGESKFQQRVWVKGGASSDETSESGELSPDRSPSPSCTPSVFSTGTFHDHLVPSHVELPPCTSCSRPLVFGQFHDSNHNCDGHGGTIRRKAYGWHCAMCDVDYCITCIPIDWEPVSEFASSAASSQTLQLSSPAPSLPDSANSQQYPPPSPVASRRRDVANAAATSRGHHV